jgi:hypothetical protein
MFDVLKAAIGHEVFAARIVVEWADHENVLNNLGQLTAGASDLLRHVVWEEALGVRQPGHLKKCKK